MKRDKSPRAQKSAKVAWECGANEYSCLPYATILWCPGVRAVSYLKTKLIMKLILWPQQSYIDLKILASTLPNWTIIND